MQKVDYADPEYKKINPLGMVPALDIGGSRAMTQANAILQYIADSHPAAKLGAVIAIGVLIGVIQDSAETALNSSSDVIFTAAAGPTREAIDPVRYLSNHSSGKMGYALAAAAARRGAAVTLISGPTALPTPPGVTRINIESAADLLAAALAHPGDIYLSAAAVADYRVERPATQKQKNRATPDSPCNSCRTPTSSPPSRRCVSTAPTPWASPPKPKTCSPTPAPNARAKTSISSSPTT